MALGVGGWRSAGQKPRPPAPLSTCPRFLIPSHPWKVTSGINIWGAFLQHLVYAWCPAEPSLFSCMDEMCCAWGQPSVSPGMASFPSLGTHHPGQSWLGRESWGLIVSPQSWGSRFQLTWRCVLGPHVCTSLYQPTWCPRLLVHTFAGHCVQPLFACGALGPEMQSKPRTGEAGFVLPRAGHSHSLWCLEPSG